MRKHAAYLPTVADGQAGFIEHAVSLIVDPKDVHRGITSVHEIYGRWRSMIVGHQEIIHDGRVQGFEHYSGRSSRSLGNQRSHGKHYG